MLYNLIFEYNCLVYLRVQTDILEVLNSLHLQGLYISKFKNKT